MKQPGCCNFGGIFEKTHGIGLHKKRASVGSLACRICLVSFVEALVEAVQCTKDQRTF